MIHNRISLKISNAVSNDCRIAELQNCRNECRIAKYADGSNAGETFIIS